MGLDTPEWREGWTMARTVAPKPRQRATKTVPLVRAQRIELVDDAGRVRATLAARPDGSPALILEDAERKGRVHLTVSAAGEPGLGMGDREGSGRVLLAVKADDSAGVAFYDGQGKLRAVLGMTAVPVSAAGSAAAKPASAMALFDRDGNPLHQVP
jgi:hypothetical protein